MRFIEKNVNIIAIAIVISLLSIYTVVSLVNTTNATIQNSKVQETLIEYPVFSDIQSKLERPEQTVTDLLTKEAVVKMYKDSEVYLEQSPDLKRIVEWKKSGYTLIENSIKVYPAKTSAYTQFTFVLKNGSDYVGVAGNYYQSKQKIIFIVSQDVSS